MISTFTPLENTTDGKIQLAEPIPYLPPATAAEYKVILEQSLGLPNYLLDGFELQFYKSQSNSSKSDYPVVVFSPGFATSRLLSSVQAQSSASHGFIVITVDHPYDATVIEFHNVEVVYGYNISDFTDDLAESLVQVRTADILFLIDQLPNLVGSSHQSGQQPSVFLYGQSLGGATAALAASLDSRVLGGVDFDGSIYGSVNDTGLDKPFILAGRPLLSDTPVTSLYNDFYDHLRKDKVLIAINGTEHLSFCDAPLLVSLRDDVTAEQQPVVEAVLGSINGERLGQILDELLFSTAQLLFSGDPEGLCSIDHASGDLPVLEEDLPCST